MAKFYQISTQDGNKIDLQNCQRAEKICQIAILNCTKKCRERTQGLMRLKWEKCCTSHTHVHMSEKIYLI